MVHWITQLENILSQSYTEQSAYDFKQGFLLLDGTGSFDEGNFEKILQTCVGIANIRKGSKGYVLVGVADRVATAERVERIFGVKAKPYERFYVVGVEHEARALGKSLEQLFHEITERIKASKVSSELKDSMTRHLKMVRYYDKSVFVFEIEAQEDPSSFDGRYFVRRGPSLEEVQPVDLAAFVRRYVQGS